MTPAQASGHPNFVTDVPVQGPTDPGTRAASCWWAQNVLPAKPACADCGNGPIPAWARTAGFAGAISFGGVGVLGFALDAADAQVSAAQAVENAQRAQTEQLHVAAAGLASDIYATLSLDQQSRVASALSKLNDQIVKTTGTTCPGWAPAIGPATTCFQAWYNLNYAAPKGPANPLRTDGVFDSDTFSALQGIVGAHPDDLPSLLPAAPALPPAPTQMPAPAATSVSAVIPAAATPAAAPAPATAALVPSTREKGLSTGAKIGIGVAGAMTLGGIVYAATRKKK